MTREQMLEVVEENASHIVFDDLLHKYWYNDQETISVTQLLAKHKISPKFDGVPKGKLKQAVDRGNMIHRDIEQWIKGAEPMTSECMCYADMLEEKGLQPIRAEFYVGNDICCGTCDTMLIDNDGEFYIDDHKTGQVHEMSVRWQCSIYAYLLGVYDYIKGIYCSHLGKDDCEMVYFDKIPKQEIERLLECEKQGILYTSNQVVEPTQDQKKLANIQVLIENYQKEIKTLEDKKKMFVDRVLESMREQNLIKVVCGGVTFTRVKETMRETINTAKLKKEHPDLAEQYKKISKVGESLRIKIGGTDND